MVVHDGGVDEEHETISPLTDEEADLFRWLRYGQLPERIRPQDMIAMVDVEARNDTAEPIVGPTGAWTKPYV